MVKGNEVNHRTHPNGHHLYKKMLSPTDSQENERKKQLVRKTFEHSNTLLAGKLVKKKKNTLTYFW